MKSPASVIVIGTLLLALSLAQNPKAPEDKPTRLIDSIQGSALYGAYCAVCHGSDARGSGPMAKFPKNAPADLTRIAARNAGAFPLARVRKVISGEQVLSSGHGTREMPVWGPIFSQISQDQDLGRVRIDNLARYLESLQTK